jgi:DNA-binding MarR family transcriptional regulator
MAISDIYVQPGHLIRRAHQLATAAFMAEAKALGMTPVQYSALLVIKDIPGIDATRLSVFIHFDRTTIGQVIGLLEAKGLITREPGVEDRRTKRIFITLQGEEALRAMTDVVPRIGQRILAPLTPVDRADLMRILAQLVDTDGEANAEAVRAKIGKSA